jgi:hypothetical protein
MVRVTLDGAAVAENYSVAIALRTIGAYGLTIGHWPDPPDEYAFDGVIYEVILQIYDPMSDLTQGIDPCCFDRDKLADWFKRIAKKGVSAAQLAAAAEALRAAARNAVLAVRGGDKARTLDQQAIGDAVSVALRRRDFTLLSQLLDQEAQAFAQLPANVVASLTADLEQALGRFGLDWSDWIDFLKLLCLDGPFLQNGTPIPCPPYIGGGGGG